MWRMKKVALLVLLCLGVFSCGGVRISPEEDDKDIETKLKILNKSPVLTFEVDGEVIDCVDIYKQPAFDHPLLKNHSLQMNPSFEINETLEVEENGEGMKGIKKCPDRTVPIRRTTKEDLLRHKTLQSFHLNFVEPKEDSNPKSFLALLGLRRSDGDVIAARAAVGIHNPICSGKQMTAAFVGISSTEIDSRDIIFAGWAKYPFLFDDDRTHLTILWFNKAQEGCFNLLCPGFVQVHQTVTLGAYFTKYSVFQGNAYEAKIEIVQDRDTKNWWFIVMGTTVGYWPKELFSELDRGAGGVLFGGVTTTDENNVSPQMGFGSFPETTGNGDYLRQAGFIRFMEYDISTGPSGLWEDSYILENSRDCYRIVNQGLTEQNGQVITFGGPGGSNC